MRFWLLSLGYQRTTSEIRLHAKPIQGAVSTDRQPHKPSVLALTPREWRFQTRPGEGGLRNVMWRAQVTASFLQPNPPGRRSLLVAVQRWRRPGIFTPHSPGCRHTARSKNRVRSNPGAPVASQRTLSVRASAGGGWEASPGVLAGFWTRAPRVLPASPQPGQSPPHQLSEQPSRLRRRSPPSP